jgi:hypothetical protein
MPLRTAEAAARITLWRPASLPASRPFPLLTKAVLNRKTEIVVQGGTRLQAEGELPLGS